MHGILDRLVATGTAAALIMVSVIMGARVERPSSELLGEIMLIASSGEVLTGDAALAKYRRQICCDQKVVVINAAKMPFIARNISIAVFQEGRFVRLTKLDDPKQQAANGRAACGKFVRRFPGGSCDEYPFRSTKEGGAGARTAEVPLREQRCQGGTVRAAYASQNITDGVEFEVVLLNIRKIPKQDFEGVDIAEDKGSCGI